MKSTCIKCILVVLVISIFQPISGQIQKANAGPTAWIGLYSDAGHSSYVYEYSGQYDEFDLWVWVLPGDEGMKCAEFSIDHHDWVWVVGQTPNPDCSVIQGNPVDPDGVTICLETCQEDWTWLYQIEMLTRKSDAAGWIEIKERPDAGAYQVLTCPPPDYPAEPLSVLNHFGLFYEGWLDEYIESAKPTITELEAVDSRTIDITFSEAPYAHPPEFFVYDAADTTDTSQVVDVVIVGGWSGNMILTLGDSMTDGSSYIVDATDYGWEISHPWNLGIIIACGDIQGRFKFKGSVATMLQSFDAYCVAGEIEISWQLSSIDEGGKFDVFRQEGEGVFTAIEIGIGESGRLTGSGGLTSQDGLSFSYIDGTALPGLCYRYRVEYSLDGMSKVLFITEPVAIPAVFLELGQNHPNPFNPSTTISYNLPAASFVSLEIYDVAGRKVRTLVRDIQAPGSKQLEWNGFDDAGSRVVSGVYFYRLRAGKEELTRKMVIMR